MATAETVRLLRIRSDWSLTSDGEPTPCDEGGVTLGTLLLSPDAGLRHFACSPRIKR